MASYTHGVNVSEKATSILTPVEATAGIPFIVGTAPVNMTDTKNVNKATLCYTFEEAVASFGYVPPKADSERGLKKFEYSISEFINSQFVLFGVSPVIIVNVLDPAKHKKTATTETVTLDSRTGSATVAESGILIDSIKLGTGLVRGEDFIVAFDDDGNIVITSLKDASETFKCNVGESISFSAEKLDPSAVTTDDVIGGVDVNGNKSGMELINECFPRFRLTPGSILAPGYSDNAKVAAVMAAKAANINEHFSAVALIDVPTDTVKKYTDVEAWKNNNNIVDPKQIVCFPMLQLDGVVYHQSTQLAGLMGQVDGDNDDVPYVSPSNKNYQMNGMVLEDGTEVVLGPESAGYLNGNGVVTALNFIDGWKCWGNRTACYPGNSDVKDSFIPIRRMFSWIGNTLILTYWQRLDYPLNRRQIDTILDTANQWLNGIAAAEQIIGGRVEFLESENPTIDIMNGIARFHVYVTPASPNREIDYILEYDASYLETLFS